MEEKGDNMSFREMRRKDRQVYDDLINEILENGEYGVLSTMGENGYPYGVPVNFVYYNDGIYFHCAKTGHKLEAIKRDNRVSFCVVTDTEILPEDFTANYKSVIAFGTAGEVELEEKKMALMLLIKKYSSGFMDKGREYVNKEAAGTVIIKISIEHITGKARM